MVKITTVKKWFTYSASVAAFLMAVSIFSPRKPNSSDKGTPIRTPLSSANLQWASEILNNKKNKMIILLMPFTFQKHIIVLVLVKYCPQ